MNYKTYEIFINKNPVEVSYFVLLCYCTGHFKQLVTIDEFFLFFQEFRFKSKEELITYLQVLNTYVNIVDKKKLTYNKLYEFLGIRNSKSSRIFFLNLDLFTAPHFLDEFNIGLTYFKTISDSLSTVQLNKYVNYPTFSESDDYKSLIPYLSFYRKLALNSSFNELPVKTINDLLLELGYKFEQKNIREDFINHLIILPYKDYYIWGSKKLYYEILNLDYFLFKLVNLDKIIGVSLNKYI